jgi:hypothetical protein
MIAALRMLFGAYLTDPKMWILIADPFYLIGDRVLISLYIAAYIVVDLKIRAICFLSE